jgi:hypothetical protein
MINERIHFGEEQMTNININTNTLTSARLEQLARSGKTADINFIMENLELNRSFLICKLIDYALGLVSTEEGMNRIEHYLFNGSTIQRNYAALFFKRQGCTSIINRAVQEGCIDEIQAYSR